MSAAVAYRAEILALPLTERVDYALALLDLYFDPLPGFYDAVADRGLRLTAAEARILFALDRRRGMWVTVQSLTAAASAGRDPDDWPADNATYAKISALRAKLEAANLPVEIVLWPEIGYRLAAPAGFAWEAGA